MKATTCLDAGAGNDPEVRGGAGNDTIYGGGGEDWLYGEADDDLIIAGTSSAGGDLDVRNYVWGGDGPRHYLR